MRWWGALAVMLAGGAAQAGPWWRDLWLRNASQISFGAGYETVDASPSIGLRALGVELHYVVDARFKEDIQVGSQQGPVSEHHEADYHGLAVGLSPISLGTGKWGDRPSLEFTYFEPFFLYAVGTLTKSVNGAEAKTGVSFVQAGTRLYLTIPLGPDFGLRLGGEAALGTLDWKHAPAPGTNTNFGGPPIRLGAFAAIALLLGQSR